MSARPPLTVIHLDKASAFQPGCKVWITFAADQSKWTQKLDWHLNFALAKWEVHQPKRQAPELKALILEEELELPESTLKPAYPIMIASREIFPNQDVVVLPNLAKNEAAAFEIIATFVRGLNLSSARLFLADDQTTAQCEKALAQFELPEQFIFELLSPLATLKT